MEAVYRFRAAFFRNLPVLQVLGLVLLSQSGGLAQVTGGSSGNPGGAGRTSGSSHTIRGKIFMPSGGFPEERIRVVLELTTGGIVSEVFSDSVGTFEFRSLAGSTYRLVVPSDGRNYETAQEVVEVSGSIPRTYSVQVYLREKNANPQSRNRMLSVAEYSQKVPKSALKLYEKSEKLVQEGKTEEAIMQLQESLKIFPDYLLALNKLGEQYANQKKFEEARELFEKAVRINTKFPQAHVNLGLLYFHLKQYQQSAKHLETANHLDESYPIAHLYLGLALMEKTPADFDQAEREMLKAIALGGLEMAYARKYLFNLNVRQQKMDKAAEQLEAYLKESPQAADAQAVRDTLARVKRIPSAPQKP